MICLPTSQYLDPPLWVSIVLFSSICFPLISSTIFCLCPSPVPLHLSFDRRFLRASVLVCLSVCVPLRIVKATAKSLATAVASLSYQLTYCALLPSNETPVEQRKTPTHRNQPNVSFCVIVFNCVDVSLTPVQIIDCAYTVCLSVCLCICVFGWVFLCAFHCFACFASTWSASKTE